VVSPFVTIDGWRLSAGLVILDHRQRIETARHVGDLLQFTRRVNGRNVYIVGSWQPNIDVLTADDPVRDAKFLYLVTEGQLDQLRAQGWNVWYLPGIREFDAMVNRFDIEKHGARYIGDLRPEAASR
jgi:hypothetical protein